MSSHLVNRGSSLSTRKLEQISRRGFLRQLGRCGSIVPASLLLPALRETLSLQRPRTATATGKTGAASTSRASFHFTDVDRKRTRLNSSHVSISYAVFCLKKRNHNERRVRLWTIPSLSSQRPRAAAKIL